MKKDEIYYKELHAASRHYDVKVWTMLAVFLAVIGWVLLGVEWRDDLGDDCLLFECSTKNGVILISAAVILFLLLLKFLKEHAYAIWIQKKINNLDEQFQGSSRKPDNLKDLSKRHPLYSMPSESEKEFSECDMIIGLKDKFREDPYFRSIWCEEKLLRFQVSKLFIWTIAALSILSLLAGITILF